jgi:hypothetical protein
MYKLWRPSSIYPMQISSSVDNAWNKELALHGEVVSGDKIGITLCSIYLLIDIFNSNLIS